MPDPDAAPALVPVPEPPASLRATSAIDGWTLTSTSRDAFGSSVVMVSLGIVTAGTALAGVFLSSLLSVWAAAVVGPVVLLMLGVLVSLIVRNKRVRFTIGVRHLIVQRGRRTERIAWSRVAPPRRVADVRDAWTQAFIETMDGDPHTWDPGREARLRVPAVAIRWTVDGRPAAYAHERTEWDGAVLGIGGGAEGVEWLLAAIEGAQAIDEERRKEEAFDEVVSGRAGERARASLEDLRGRQD